MKGEDVMTTDNFHAYDFGTRTAYSVTDKVYMVFLMEKWVLETKYVTEYCTLSFFLCIIKLIDYWEEEKEWLKCYMTDFRVC